MAYVVRVKMDGLGELEVHGDSIDKVATLINSATKKFFSGTTITETDM